MTPAINLLKREKIAHTVRSYVHDAHAESYGGEAVDKLGLDPAQVFKTLLASTETHELLVAIVPVAGMPPKRPAATDASPWPTNSRSGS